MPGSNIWLIAALLRGAAMSGANGKWAALVGSRLCHDLVSPLGAIGNGLELLAMTQPVSPELTLLNDATASAQARLHLFRLAFGVASAGQNVTAGALEQALAALGERIICENAVSDPLPREHARRLVLAALCAESALAWGGTMTLEPDAVHASADRLRLEPALWSALAANRPPDDPVPAVIHFALLADSGVVAVDTSETALTIRL